MESDRDRWRFYRLLEERLIDFDTYIPVNSKQLRIKSPILADIIINASIQFESVMRQISIKSGFIKKNGFLYARDQPRKMVRRKKSSKSKKRKKRDFEVAPTIKFYKKKFPKLGDDRTIHVKRLYYEGNERQPLIDWSTTPQWWKDYNELKHNMFINWKKKAKYETAILALSSLLIINFEHEIRRNPTFKLPSISSGDIKITNEYVMHPITIDPIGDFLSIETKFFKYRRARSELAFQQLQY